jgi:hypothetical protein
MCNCEYCIIKRIPSAKWNKCLQMTNTCPKIILSKDTVISNTSSNKSNNTRQAHLIKNSTNWKVKIIQM